MPYHMRVVIEFCCALIVINQVADSAYLTITPNIENLRIYTGANYMLRCQYDTGHDVTSASQLIAKVEVNWIDKNGDIVRGHPQTSMVFSDRTPNSARLKISNAKVLAAGQYTCEIKVDGVVFDRRSVDIDVVEKLAFAYTSNVEGGLLGQALDIDCGIANAWPRENITIDFQVDDFVNGVPHDPRYRLLPTKLVIDPLTNEDKGRMVHCVATGSFVNGQRPRTNTRTVSIDVYDKPHIDTSKHRRYAMLGDEARIECLVLESNPPVRDIRFYRGAEEMTTNTHRQFDIEQINGRMMGVLKITHATESDMGEYMCLVHNTVTSANASFDLVRAVSPGSVNAEFVCSDGESITWHLEVPTTCVRNVQGDDALILHRADEKKTCVPKGNLPITRYRIEYMQHSQYQDFETAIKINRQTNKMEYENALWDNTDFTKRLEFPANDNNTFVVKGLLNKTDYKFRFRVGHEAGFGQPRYLTARNEKQACSDVKPQPIKHTRGINSSHQSNLSSLILVYIVLILFS